MTAKKTKGPQEQGADRLSDLPDCLILNVLSFVDTRTAVRTGALSKRWSRLWTFLPILNFDSQSFRNRTSFNNCVNRFLTQRCGSEPSNLVSLKFHTESTNKSVLERVISYALSRSVQNMYMNHKMFITVNHRLLYCKSLRTLQLERYKVFHDFFSRCMNLETLVLNGCHLYRADEVFKVSSPSLASLKISNLLHDGYELQVVVSCPRLSSFIYKGGCPSLFSMDGCPVLDRVNICLDRPLSEIQKLNFLSRLKYLLQEVLLRAKSLVLWVEGLRLTVKTVLSDDYVRAMIFNGDDTNQGEELHCSHGSKEEIELFLGSILQRFEEAISQAGDESLVDQLSLFCKIAGGSSRGRELGLDNIVHHPNYSRGTSSLPSQVQALRQEMDRKLEEMKEEMDRKLEEMKEEMDKKLEERDRWWEAKLQLVAEFAAAHGQGVQFRASNWRE